MSKSVSVITAPQQKSKSLTVIMLFTALSYILKERFCTAELFVLCFVSEAFSEGAENDVLSATVFSVAEAFFVLLS